MNNIKKETASKLIFGTNDYNPDVCFLVPTYKRNDMLKKTIESILNMEPSTFISYHIVIVSNDPEIDISNFSQELDDNKISIFANSENIGMVGNINQCLHLAKGDYYCFIQDDDVLLPSFLKKIEEILNSEEGKHCDCIIPNRYLFCDNKGDNSFGTSLYKSLKKKNIINKVFGNHRIQKLTKVSFLDCADVWYNCFGGGPTCGILFKAKTIKSKEFSNEFLYSFDYHFFINYSQTNAVYLLDDYLSVYRMTNSASNNPLVQLDFFKCDIYLVDLAYNYSKFVRKYKNEIILFSILNKSKACQELIKKEGFMIQKKSFKYYIFRIIRFIRLIKSGFMRTARIPKKYINLL